MPTKVLNKWECEGCGIARYDAPRNPCPNPACSTHKEKVLPRDMFRGQQGSIWKFWQHGITSSFLASFNNCLEQTRLSFVEGWKSRTEPLAFAFGTCGHWILEQGYANMANAVRDYDNIGQWCHAAISEYERKWLSETPDPSRRQIEQQELVYGLAEAVMPAYFKRWDGDFTGTYTYGNNTIAPVKWVSLEKVFDIPYRFRDGMATHIRGRRDGVFLDSKDRYWVFDTKCRSVINDDDVLDTMAMDLQQMLYLYVTYRELKAAGAKNPYPAGMILNVIRRPGQRRLKDETLQHFLSRVQSDVQDERRYDHYFIRYELTISPRELIKWVNEQLVPMMTAVRMWWEGVTPHYANPNALISKYGRCELFLPIVKGVYDQCYRRTVPFSELAA